MHQEKHLSLTREQLYELVWSKPMQRLAEDFGVTDRASAKLCARKQVPVPPRGYWAKKSSVQKVVRPPWPTFVAKEEPKTEGAEPEVQKPAKKKTNISSAREDRDKKIKQKIRDFRHRLSNGIQYIILMDTWSCGYSFGLNSQFNPLYPDKNYLDYFHRELYSEYRTLTFKGKFLEPLELQEQKVEIHFSQNHYLNELERDKYRLDLEREDLPKSVGFLHKNKPFSFCHVYFPEDAMNFVLAAAVANKIKFMTLYGEKMRYGKASIFNFWLEEEREEEE
jgi:hypothetical protein